MRQKTSCRIIPITAACRHALFHGLHQIAGTQMDIDVGRLKDTMAGNGGNLMDVESNARKIGQTEVPECMGCQFW